MIGYDTFGPQQPPEYDDERDIPVCCICGKDIIEDARCFAWSIADICQPCYDLANMIADGLNIKEERNVS